MEYIPIFKSEVPYRFEIRLGQEFFEFEVRYNMRHDFFTVDLYKNGEALAYGQKLVYGQPLFEEIRDSRFPAPQLVPYDEAGLESRVTYANLGKTVFLGVV